ncbi:MAG: trypsin-like peptidase domain-containing protein [Pseudomonadota bacterium]
MKKCPNPDCNLILGETIKVCPACGRGLEPAPVHIDDYDLVEIVRETSAGVLYRARPKNGESDVMLRLYPAETVWSNEEVQRIDQEFTAVSQLSRERVVQHIASSRAGDGRLLRVSEWIDGVAWGDLTASRFFRDPHKKKDWIDLFIQMAEALNVLHHGGRIMPHLSLDDLLLFKDGDGGWKIKLDYKLSPIPHVPDLSPANPTRLTRHPDLIAQRPLDHRSDIWTLGRLWVELLIGTDDFDDCRKVVDGIYHRFEPIVLHRKLSGLLRAMVDNDLDKRPLSLDKVIASLNAITAEDIAKWDKFAHDPTKKKKIGQTVRLYVAAAACVVAVLVVAIFLYQRWQTSVEMTRLAEETRRQAELSVSRMTEMIQGNEKYFDAAIADSLSKALVSLKGMLPEQKMTMLTEKYRRSTAFVLSVYYLEADGRKFPVAGGTGTAFLVSSDGYLLTNRHVVCPWLKDGQRLQEAFEQANQKGVAIRLGYDLFVWFDGDQAFRVVAGSGSDNIEDSYRLSSAYRSDGKNGKKVEIMGVMPEPSDLAEASGGLRDDVAVLRVYPTPAGAVPVPLRKYENEKGPSKGASVFTLGFPYGRESIIGAAAVSRCTDGTISRVFENAISVNTDLHPGNSGGPVIDLDGFAVGIASSLFIANANTEGAQAQSSMGFVLPIEKARPFLDDVRLGHPQWTGMPMYVFDAAIGKAREAALAGDQDEALRIMEELIASSAHPSLYFWAGILSAQGDDLTERGKKHLEKALSLDPGNNFTKFLLYRADFLTGAAPAERAFRSDLLGLDWRNPQELFSYLTRMLEGGAPVREDGFLGDGPEETAFINWTAACLEKARGAAPARIQRLRAAHAADSNQGDPLTFLIETEMLQAGIKPETDHQPPPDKKKDDEINLTELFGQSGAQEAKPEPEATGSKNGTDLIGEAVDYAAKGLWREALDSSEQYLAKPNWESANMLGMGLLKCQCLYLAGDKQRAESSLREYIGRTNNPWYRRMAGCLLGELTEDELRPEFMASREKTLTLATALGLKAEADGAPEKAIEYYNDALDAGLADWLEFRLALGRREKIRSAKQ